MPLFVAFAFVIIGLQGPAPTSGKVNQPKQQNSNSAQQTPAPDQRGTEQSPLVVKTLETTKSKTEIDQEANDRQQKTTNDRRIVILTGVLALVAIGQLGVYLYQAIKLRETVKSAGEQSAAMNRHIEEAARSANAMEGISQAIQIGNKAILRAYLTVIVGEAIYQERREGMEDLRFEAKPQLNNTGNTPARKVRIQTAADILPIPIPANFGFPLPEPDTESGDATVAAHHGYALQATVKDFVREEEVGSIKEGNGRCLCVWGLITYEDFSGDKHSTKFAQQITWLPTGRVLGYYIPGQNDAD